MNRVEYTSCEHGTEYRYEPSEEDLVVSYYDPRFGTYKTANLTNQFDNTSEGYNLCEGNVCPVTWLPDEEGEF